MFVLWLQKSIANAYQPHLPLLLLINAPSRSDLYPCCSNRGRGKRGTAGSDDSVLDPATVTISPSERQAMSPPHDHSKDCKTKPAYMPMDSRPEAIFSQQVEIKTVPKTEKERL